MPRRPIPETSGLPRISFEDGKRRIVIHISKGEELLNSRPITETKFNSWSTGAYETIERTFGRQSVWLTTFVGQRLGRDDPDNERYLESWRAQRLQERVHVLKDVQEQIDLELSATHTANPDTFWNDLDPDIIRVAKKLFEDGHFRDAALCAFIEVNDHVKQIVLTETGQELDGASLMTTAFSLKSPIIKLTHLSTQSDKDIQQGYMQIFAGSMTGHQKPKGSCQFCHRREPGPTLSLLSQSFDEGSQGTSLTV